jgi:hypothetical protein
MKSEIARMPAPEAQIGRTGRPTRFRWLTLALGALTILISLGHFRGWLHAMPGDFSAFYCGGQAVLQGEDPYRVQPSLRCEQAITGGMAANLDGKVDLPAPLPGYDFAPLAVLALLPARGALYLYGLLMLGAIGVIAYGIARLSALPIGVAVSVAALGVAYDSIDWGQLAPFAIAALTLAAWLLRCKKSKAAAIVLCLSLIQPQSGIPAVLSAFFFVKQTRVTIAACSVVLLGAAVACVGLRGLTEYPTVLALQSRAEVYWVSQYSLTWLVHTLGGSVNAALIAGSASYALLVIAALAVVARHRRAAGENGALVLLPAAAAVLGGTFIHLYQIKIALVAAVVLFIADSVGLGVAIAIALLFMPFTSAHFAFRLAGLPTLVTALAGIWATVYTLTRYQANSIALRHASIATAVAAIYFAFLYAIRPHQQLQAPMAGVNIVHHATALGPVEWLQFMERYQAVFPVPVPFLILEKAPIWIGLIILLVSAVRALRTSKLAPLRTGGIAYSTSTV